MRTTLTLDPDVARLVREAMRQRRQGMKRVINDALRRALAPTSVAREPYRVEAHRSELAPGVDLAGLNGLADDQEAEAVLGRTRS